MTTMKMEEIEVLEWLYHYGYFFTPEALKYGLVKKEELTQLKLSNEIVQVALSEAQSFNSIVLDAYAFEHHGRRSYHDGAIGPATEQLIETPRCGHPDFYHPDSPEYRAMAAVGTSGNWKRCHGIGEFHAASINVTNSPPSHLAPHFGEVIRRITEANRQIGLQLYWDGVGSPIKSGKRPYNITWTWVKTSSGWIGLAQVASNVSCTASALFSRYLESYMSSSAAEAKIRQWSVLGMHELGHTMGSGHTSGGVMNPNILSLAASWLNDILLPWLRTRYGGVPVPTEPTPDPDPEPQDTFFRGEVELIQGGQSRGKFILIPSPRII